MNDETNTNISIEPDYPRDANGNVTYPDTSPEEIARKKYKESQERQDNLKTKRMKFGAIVLAFAFVTAYGGASIIKDTAKAVPEMIKSAQESDKLEHKFEGKIKYYEVKPGEGWGDVAKQLINYSNYEPSKIIEAIKSIPDNAVHLQGLDGGNFVAYFELPGDKPIEPVAEPIGQKPITSEEANN